ncbi:type 1 glycerol-3-phosphate oxidase [Schleiferilactobacillus perolens]|jgi:glycerol-3-phosphate dehydrogenase|uniref:type 1 glycerol-3-phosphate oxidase n=1 Tax=Schleiferilactobacillus perolens TaxID=100468 RepID=UPI002353929A|nr:type 1 glycerol-3-phosphate oxidase [Schleiferilactobacillus perolens]MCI2170068.1 type 1 glycerol-3-phosphate oxidase [Schleiferilactobacillus perolens]
MAFSKNTRKQTIENLKHTDLDLLIGGGGITGAGVAIQAAASGVKTGLIEMQDFAEGTSSRSTKLVHGGIRYLKTFDVGVVSDTVKERAVVQGIAPHIPRPFPMLMPIYDEPGSTFDMFSVKIAMNLYDQLADVEGSQYANYTVTRDEVLQREPHLEKTGLQGGGVYLDYVNNDARLVIENIKEADELGASVASHVQATGVIYNDAGQVAGLHVKDLLTDEEFDIHAKLVINTTGPWSDKFKALDNKESQAPTLRPTKGVHLVVDGSRLPVPQPTYLDTGLNDGRMFFVVPREGKTYFGTTDTDYTGDYEHPRVEQEDLDYLLKVINTRYPEAHITIDDIQASWAGLRPLIANNSSSDYNGGGANKGKVSDESFDALIKTVDAYEDKTATRQDVERAISKLETAHAEAAGPTASQVSRGSSLHQAPDGMITLSGGKITDYRKMAAGALALIRRLLAEKFHVETKDIDSKTLQVSGGHFDPTNVYDTIAFYTRIAMDAGLPEEDAKDLANRFGSNTSRVVTYVQDGAAPGLSLKETISLRYSINEEMTLNPVDYLLRRTNAILFHAETLPALKQPVIDEMARLLDWDADEKASEMSRLDAAIAESELTYLKQADTPAAIR